MWLKLTDFEGNPIRVNMSKMDAYYPCNDEGTNTAIDIGDNMSYKIKETCEQIDDALISITSKLRLQSGWG